MSRGRGRGRGTNAELLRDVHDDIGGHAQIARDKSPPKYPACEIADPPAILAHDKKNLSQHRRINAKLAEQPPVFDIHSLPFDPKLLNTYLHPELLVPQRQTTSRRPRPRQQLTPRLPKRLRADSNMSLTAAQTGKDGNKLVEELIKTEDTHKGKSNEPEAAIPLDEEDDDLEEESHQDDDDDYGKNYFNESDSNDSGGADDDNV